MKKLIAVSAMLLSGAAFADAGPLYISYPGYCNVKRIYVTNTSDIYGTEIGCTASIGEPMLGVFSSNGDVFVSQGAIGAACLHLYRTDGGLRGACSDGTKIVYNSKSTYSVRAYSNPQGSVKYSVSREQPDLEAIKHLPSLF